NGLRAGPAAPYPAEHSRDQEEAEAQRGHAEEEQPRVLRVQTEAEEKEAAGGNVEKERGTPSDPNEGEGGRENDEDRADDHAPAGVAAAHVGRDDLLAYAVGADGAPLLDDRQLDPPLGGAHVARSAACSPGAGASSLASSSASAGGCSSGCSASPPVGAAP